MKKYILTLSFAVACLGSKAQSISALKRDMYGIASDATEGRFTGSPGYLKAAKYVVSQLKAAGLKSYLQPVPFVWDNYTGSSLVIKGRKYPHSANSFIVLQRGHPAKGKWVVLSPGDSVKGEPAGIILLPDTNQAKDWEIAVIRQYRFGYMHYVPDGIADQCAVPTIMVSPAIAENLKAGDSVSVMLTCKQERKTGDNVIAILPGTDRRLIHETIVIGAHLDHIGWIGKHIYNGANDDASGCAAELETAKMLAVHPCARPVIFAFFCGEELNLKGSHWFNDHLPPCAGTISAAINLEQLGSKHRSFHGVWALGDQQFKSAFYASGSRFTEHDLQFSTSDSLKVVLSNTDAYSFMNKNIPSLLLGSGGFDEHHTPQDKIDLIDFEHLWEATRLLINMVSLMGNSAG